MAISLALALETLGPDCLPLEQVARTLGVPLDALPADLRQAAGEVPFSAADLQVARGEGQILVFRLAHDAEQPLTVQRLIDRFPADFEPLSLSKVGYSLREEWGITLEPLAKTDTCTPGWHLAFRAPLPASYNLSYYEQDAVIAESAAGRSGVRRRTAVEATFDLVVYRACRGQKLLAHAFDWTSSRTVDAGYLYVGGFGERGMALVGFSAAVRHATLGVCPTRGAA